MSRGPLERIWAGVLERLGESLGAEDVRKLIYPLRPVALTATELRLEAPNELALVCVTESCLAALGAAVASMIGPRQVVLQLAAREQGELFPELSGRRAQSRPWIGTTFDPRYTFATFVVGSSNQFAHAAARAVATQPGDHYNPLFIYGGVGLGKTHLMNAIGQHMLARQPLLRVGYLSCEVFMNELISSLRRDRMEEFKRRFRQVDVLLLDDVQLLAGRERTQEEFFHTFNTLHERRRQIVLTSDKVPKDIPDLEERLRNRFEWGLIADIQPPDVETRVAILQKKAELLHIPLPHDVALLLAEELPTNVRELEGSLTRLAAHASVSRCEITVDYAREVLRAMRPPRTPAITFDHIASAVCDRFSLRPMDLRSRRRSRHVAVPRQIAMYLCRRLLGASFPRIGELFDRDHSTAVHATDVVDRRLKNDPGFQATVEGLERAIRNQAGNDTAAG